jgi:MoaA/NifB/PqqE/SkfB family radical SAM enzyme
MTRDEYSPFKVIHHLDTLARVKRGDILAPLFVRIFPTNRCNQHCRYCFNRLPDFYASETFKESDEIPTTRMESLLDELQTMGVKAIEFCGGGEPLLYPDIGRIIKGIFKRGFEFGFMTNGTFLSKPIADILANSAYVRVSVDAISPIVYEFLKGVPGTTLDTVLRNLEYLCSIPGRKCTIGVSYLVEQQNFLQVIEFAECMKAIGVDNVSFGAAITGEMQYRFGSWRAEAYRLCTEAESIQNERFTVFNHFSTRSNTVFQAKRFSKCGYKDLTAFIGADLNVYTCCSAGYNRGALIGSIREQPFEDLWFGVDKAVKYAHHSPHPDCPFPCIYWRQNEFLDYVLKNSPKDVNFL